MSQHKRPNYHSTISLLCLYYRKHLPSEWIHIFLRVVNRVARPPSAKSDIRNWTVFSHHPTKSGIPIFNVFTYKYHSSKWYTSSNQMSHHSNKSGIPSLLQEWYSNSQHVSPFFETFGIKLIQEWYSDSNLTHGGIHTLIYSINL